VRGLLVGRFQPFHRGHLAVVREIRAKRGDEELILGVGSAQESFTWKNPFTTAERLEMIARALGEAKIAGVLPVPLPDIQRHAMWVRYAETVLPPFGRVYTNNPLTALLFGEAKYPVEAPTLVDRARFEGETVREHLAADRDWRPLVPPAVAAYLAEIGAPARLGILRAAPSGPPAGGTSA
jgi:nicotinamide-nucleotide adenylyltransferase